MSNLQTTLQSSAHSDSDTCFSEVNRFTEWCTHNFPELNTQKTQEMIFDPILIFAHLPVVISNQTIEQVGSYKYVGIHIDSKLSWSVPVEAECSRAQKRLYFLRRLKEFGVSTNILLLVCRSVQIRTPVHHKHFFENSRLYSLFHSRKYLNRPGTLVRQAQKICSDATHVLHSQYQLLPSGKRYTQSQSANSSLQVLFESTLNPAKN